MDLEQTFEALKRLNEDVSKPLPKATDDNVSNAERELGFQFPNEIKLFLKEASHITYDVLEPVHVVLPESPDYILNAIEKAKAWGVPEDWMPICEDNSNFYCYAPDGIIRFWDHNGPNDESWPNLATWIKEVWIEGN